jgi:Leucine-rich repeat (LRR) protein
MDLACSCQQLLSLPGVRVLKMEGCWLKSTPITLPILAQLTHLSPSRHRMTATAPSATLQLLVHLALVCCRPKAVPKHLSSLTTLTRLDLAGNSLQGGWQRLLPLTRLRHLSLRGCLLQAVPQQLPALTALTRLDLNANKQLDGGWQHLLPLTQLRELNFVLCGLTAVPEQVSALTALTRLALSHNSLTVVPQHLSVLRNLAYLSLCFNNVSSGFQHLLPLTGLTLSRAPVPAVLAALPHLRISYVHSPPPSATPLQACIAALILLGLLAMYLAYGWLA